MGHSVHVMKCLYVYSSIPTKQLHIMTSKLTQCSIMSLRKFSQEYCHYPTLLSIAIDAIDRVKLGGKQFRQR